ncbi:hypothetical protein [Altericista sp. CCNU0014]|uniref:hypothetical protein n=1 Tax=Altericista sp. CCNU0014 TaxID=3082949 RepID=UPI00384E5823
MLGTFQQSQLRVEIGATASQLNQAILRTAQLRQWLFPQILTGNLLAELSPGLTFTSWIGFVPVEHNVDAVETEGLRLILSRGIDGIHEWQWGDGWVQSCLEGVSFLPLQAGNTATLLRLKAYLALAEKFRR